MYNYSSEETRRKAEELKKLLGAQQKNRSNNREGGENKFRWFNFPIEAEIKVTLRILPIFEEGGFMIVSRHRELPGERNNELCLQTHGMHCPICEVLQSYRGRLDTRIWEKQDKVYVNALFVRATDSNNQPVQLKDFKGNPIEYMTGMPYLCPLGTTTFQWLVDSLTDPEKGDVMHPVSGRNISMQRGTKGGAFKLKEFAFNTTPIGSTEQEIANIMSNRYKMNDIWRAPDDNFLKKLKESASMLDATIKEKLGKLTAGVGVTATTHPRSAPPTPAQTLGNPAFSQPTPAAPSSQPVVNPMSNGPIHNTYSPPPAAPAVQPQPAQVAPSVVGIPPVQANAGYVPAGAPPVAAAIPTATAAPTGNKVVVPPGAPACFADKNVYNEAATKCQVCSYDYHCQRAISAK
jgi:hypothetical protein